MKVLFVFNHPAPYKVRLFNELANHIDLHVIFERTNAKDRPDAFYNAKHYKFKCTFLRKGAFGRENSNTNELRKFISEHHHEYNVIIMNGYSTLTEMKAIKFMRSHYIPFVLYINGGVVRKEPRWKYHLKHSYISSAWKYISPCEEADQYLKYYGAKQEEIFHYPYSTFYDEDIVRKVLSKEDKQKIRDAYHLPEGKLFVSAGQFIERKNNLEILKHFVNREENIVLVGSGKEEKKYLKFIKRNKMKNAFVISFLEKAKLFELLRACDYFITLSKEDIYGHTTNEAMANGLGVISSNRVVSSLHLIKEGYNGFLVDLYQPEQIDKAIDEVNEKMQTNAIKTAKKNTIENTVKAHLKIFEELAK